MRYPFIRILALLLACLPIWSLAQHSGDKRISGRFQNDDLPALAGHLYKASGFQVFFDSTLHAAHPVIVDAEDLPLQQVLNQLFPDTSICFAIDDRGFIFLTARQPIITRFGEVQRATGPEPDTAKSQSPESSKPGARQSDRWYSIGDSSVSASAGRVSIAGYVREISTGEPVAGATVYADSSGSEMVTDQSGFYHLELAPGNHLIHIQSLGMQPAIRKIRLHGSGMLNIDIQTDVATLKHVIVAAQKNSNVNKTLMGVEKIDIRSMKQLPVVFGETDILRAVLSIPGVKTVGEASTGLNVRGGSTDQNLILYNESTIYNPSHFFGLFSTFNPDAVKDVELYKSSIPARFGGRLSSVLDIHSREGNRKKISGTAGIGLLTSRLVLEGPLKKDGASFLLGLRSTYANWLLKLLPDQYKNSRAFFGDAQFQVNIPVNFKNNILLSLYASNDQYNLNSDTIYNYGNRNISLKWKHLFSNQLNMTNAVGFDRYQYSINSDKDSLQAYRLKFDVNQAWFRNSFRYYPSTTHSLEWGLSTLFYSLHPGDYEPDGPYSIAEPKHMQTEQALETSLFLSDQMAISHALSIELGVRYTTYQFLGPSTVYEYAPGLPVTPDNRTDTIKYDGHKVIQQYGGPEIRVSARYAFSDSFSIKAGFNTQRQNIHMLSNTTAMAPTDIWKLSDPHIQPQMGSQVSLGLYRNFSRGAIEISLEGYYKIIKHYLDYRSGAQLILNDQIETAVLATRGKAYGIEFLLKKREGKINGWIAYTWSRILLQMDDPDAGESINEGKPYPASYDKPNDATLVANYRFSHRFSLSFNTTYSTGRPITVPAGRFYYGGSMRTLYGSRNGYRIPDYFRADIALNLDGNHKVQQKTHNSWTLGVYNITGRKNPYSVYYISENGVINGYQLSIFGSAIPYINFNIRF